MTTQIYSTKVNGDLALAMVETLALALVAVVGLVLLRHTQGEDLLVALGKGTAPRRRPIERPAVRALATAAGWLFAVLLLLPHLTLLLVSLVPYATWTTETLPPVLSLVNYRRVFSEPERLRPLLNSFWMASVSTAAAVVVALAAGWLLVRRRAAASLGAGRWVTLRRVTLPLLGPALAAGASLAFVGALGDFVSSVVLYTYDTRPIAIEIMSSLRLNELGVAAVFGVLLMVCSAAVLSIGARR